MTSVINGKIGGAAKDSLAKDCLPPLVIRGGGSWLPQQLPGPPGFEPKNQGEFGIPFHWQETVAALGVSLETQGTCGAVTGEHVVLPAPL